MTEYDSTGDWQLAGVDWVDLIAGEVISRGMAKRIKQALEKLKVYEDICDDPDRLRERLDALEDDGR